MTSRSLADKASMAGTALLCVCALLVTGIVVRREVFPARAAATTRFEKQRDWLSYSTAGHRVGPEDARVVLVEFFDYQCPACRRFETTVNALREKYPRDLAIVYRHLPLSIHRHARGAAIASECAASQGKFAEMHATMFELQDSIGTMPWEQFARRAGVARHESFLACMADVTSAQPLDRDSVAAANLGARATPTLLIDGVRVRGAIPISQLDSLVQSALRRSPSN